jgi:hypothetical protein
MAESSAYRPDDRAKEGGAEEERLLPESTGAPAPGVIAEIDDPELARLQIERTRERMSETLGQIEGAIARKRERIEERMDVAAPVRRTARENPLAVAGGVFLAGLALGWLTGGSADDDEPQPAVRRFTPDFDRERSYAGHWEERAHTWEQRARRLMELANRQELELLAVRGESVPLRRRGRRGSPAAGRGGGLDGMPLPPHPEEGWDGPGQDAVPAPV